MKFSCPHCKHTILISIDKPSNELEGARDKEFIDPNDIILEKVSKVTGVSQERILDITSKLKSAVNARHIAMYVLRKYRALSYPEIGNYFKADHSTAINAVDKVQKKIDKDVKFFVDSLQKIDKEIQNYAL